MPNILKTALCVWVFSALCQTVIADSAYTVTLDTAPLVGHPAGPFYVEFVFTDGSGYGDGNNTVSASDFGFGGGSALGSPVVFGGASGSLETGVTIIDTSFLSLFYEQFSPGLLLTFNVSFTSNNDADGIPDGFTVYVLDNSGLPIPTLAPSGNYFLSAALGSTGPAFNTYGSNPSQAPYIGDPVPIPAPTITPLSSVPEPPTICLLSFLATLLVFADRLSRKSRFYQCLSVFICG